jgi:hypothetical protein
MTASETSSFSELARDILEFNDERQSFPIHSQCCNGSGDCLDSSRLDDIFTRFRLWAGNLGALHRAQDPRGLDSRLDDAPDVAKRIRRLLEETKDLLRQGSP